MKTHLLPFGWILLGLCLCFSSANLTAQDRSSRSQNTLFGRKLENRNFKVSQTRSKAPPAVKKIGWFSSRSSSPAVTATSRPQRYLSSTQLTAAYGSASGRFNQEEARRSAISILPDGTVITRDAVYGPEMVTESGEPLNEFDLATPTTSPHEILYRNSAVAPPPPPVPASSRPATVKPDLSKVKTAEKISPGLAKSPYPPHSLLDIQGMRSGSLAEDPASRKLFRVP